MANSRTEKIFAKEVRNYFLFNKYSTAISVNFVKLIQKYKQTDSYRQRGRYWSCNLKNAKKNDLGHLYVSSCSLNLSYWVLRWRNIH